MQTIWNIIFTFFLANLVILIGLFFFFLFPLNNILAMFL